MNKIYQKAVRKLNQLGKKLAARDFPYIVTILHQDGTRLYFHNAQYSEEEVEGVKFIFVWTEHCGYHAFFTEDLAEWRQTKHRYTNKPDA
jgi:hypothetical protein